MSDAAVRCSDLSFSWPDDTPVFENLSFTVGVGRTGLVAPNGAGKSTLLKLIAGELRPVPRTREGMLRQPSWLRLRPDLAPEDSAADVPD
ncbi:ATP-binding cassette domain-containing protein, partial [Streptomyces sp. NPDC044948]|uniref:ATP-binding cassette domain-containing protein n=1 Tax=Streptomyces sp. NPDC044948 TaxID=3157092 RepID=UPI0033E5217A